MKKTRNIALIFAGGIIFVILASLFFGWIISQYYERTKKQHKITQQCVLFDYHIWTIRIIHACPDMYPELLNNARLRYTNISAH